MALNWYQCRHCAAVLKQESGPSTNGCEAKPYHSWTRLGAVGDVTFTCKKCDLAIQTDSYPNSTGCPVASFHVWKKEV